MSYLEICSNCGKKNQYSFIDGNKRFHCVSCNTIHYENPKPTSAIICTNNSKILLARRAFEPGKGEWGLPGGFMELNETLEEATMRELKEETMLDGSAVKTLGTCSHFNTIFGDILLIGLEVQIDDWSNMQAGDDAAEAVLFPLEKLPRIAFPCHEKIVSMYLEQLKS